MRRLLVPLAACALLLAGLTAPADAGIDPRQVRLTLLNVANGLQQPVALAHPPGDNRMFVVERAGRIRVIRDGKLKATPFLDIRSIVNDAGEGGLLGLAFRPDYKTSGRFFVAWTDSAMTLRVSRFRASPTSDVAGTTRADILKVPHPNHTNHNGGQLAFGAGGYLFVGTGDGGGSGDPAGNAQNLNSLLGKILRIDVTNYPAGSGYAIPSTNPYAGGGGRREIWAVGLRNPWRFSFDKHRAAELWVGDVGQYHMEEVSMVASGGKNLGWDCREGTMDVASRYGGTYCKSSGYLGPVSQYNHDLGCAVIGGYVYRGAAYESLLGGTYVFGDYCSGRLWGLGRDSSGRRVRSEMARFNGQILAFGQSNVGHLYLLGANGSMYRLGAVRR